jgi:2-polyprenyl-3-methyl-5-hydroxy-6-metoxy-1,4-benzoquinol methylase
MMELVERKLVNVHAREVAAGQRFAFGENWSRFLAALDEERIERAEASLKEMLEVESLAGRSFLDIGSGSGLFSLAARRLGARVFSFDYDPQSVACTAELRRRYFPNDSAWRVEAGSVLNAEYVNGLGQFDVVYSWGVLHHTGAMWQALELAGSRVAPGGQLFIAIYNDLGSRSARWVQLKRLYNRLPAFLRAPYTLAVMAPGELKTALGAVLRGQAGAYWQAWRRGPARGMNRWRDMVDWVGGYPYEYAKPEELLDFYRRRGFTLMRLICGGVGLGCNEFVFKRQA